MTRQQDLFITLTQLRNRFQPLAITAGTIPGLRRISSSTVLIRLLQQGPYARLLAVFCALQRHRFFCVACGHPAEASSRVVCPRNINRLKKTWLVVWWLVKWITWSESEVCVQPRCNPLWLTGLKAPTNYRTNHLHDGRLAMARYHQHFRDAQ